MTSRSLDFGSREQISHGRQRKRGLVRVFGQEDLLQPPSPRLGAVLLDNQLLRPLEEEWAIKEPGATPLVRVKNLRTAILPEMINGDLAEAERARRWRQLTDCYYAQQMSHYPRNYIGRENNVPERILETVERFEEDLTDSVRAHGPLHVVIQVGDAIEVSPSRDRTATTDPVMQAIEDQLREMLAQLASEAAGGD